MPVPDYQSLMLPVLAASAGGESRIGHTVDRLAEQLGLSADDRTQLLPSGKQTVFGNRVHWAKTYLTKAGLLESTRRGHFRITERGHRRPRRRRGAAARVPYAWHAVNVPKKKRSSRPRRAR
jgi:restriction system protein